MPLLCAVQSWKESRTAQINKIVRYPGSQPREVEFTIIDRDGTHLKGMFYIPDGFDTSILHQGAAEIWTVELGARQNPLGDAAVCITAITILGQRVGGDNIRPLR